MAKSKYIFDIYMYIYRMYLVRLRWFACFGFRLFFIFVWFVFFGLLFVYLFSVGVVCSVSLWDVHLLFPTLLNHLRLCTQNKDISVCRLQHIII
jgi:hypothetical protein